MMMKSVRTVALLSLCTTLMLPSAHAAESLDGIAAVVNESIITQSEVDTATARFKKQLQSANTAIPPSAELHKQVIEQLINRKLQLQLAEQAGFKATESDVDHAIATIAKQNNVTVSELYQKVAEQGGMDRTTYRDEIREELTIDRIQQQEVGNRINISKEEVSELLHSKTWQSFNDKEYHLEDLLVAIPDAPSPSDLANAKKRAEALAAKMRQEGHFTDASNSEDPSLQSGDLGWRKLAEVPSAFANVVSTLPANSIAGPIQTSNGFHIVHIAGIRSAEKTAERPSEEQAKQQIYQRKLEAALQSWIRKIRSEAFVNITS